MLASVVLAIAATVPARLALGGPTVPVCASGGQLVDGECHHD